MDLSEQVSKWPIRISLNKKIYYSIWETDGKGIDTLFIDEKNEILLFESIELLKKSAYKKYEDEPGILIQNWVNRVSENEEIPIYDFDKVFNLISNQNENTFLVEEYKSIVEIVHLASDYGYQAKDKYLISLYESEEISSFLENSYDLFGFRINQSKNIKKIIFKKREWGEIMNKLNELFRSFERKMTIIN